VILIGGIVFNRDHNRVRRDEPSHIVDVPCVSSPTHPSPSQIVCVMPSQSPKMRS
jgi:hypothetical protein